MSSSCPDMGVLEMLAGGALNAGESNDLTAHTASCEACRGRLAEVRENLEFVGPLRRVLDRMGDESGSSNGGGRAAMPEFVGRYRIIREIGRGGMGVVFEAEQPNPRRRVAVKILHAGLGTDGRIEKMFQREAQALGRLKHPSIAAIYEAGQTERGQSFFAMELVSGRPLTVEAREARSSVRARLELFQRVCEAVASAHQRGVIHRDLKPSNILVDAGGVPKILDFGLAKILEQDEGAVAITSPGEEGRIQGTLPYMSPEQVRGQLGEIDVRSDVYSLGVILHELLSGEFPYPIDRGRLAEAAMTICERPPARLGNLDRGLRGDVETIVLKALEKEPDRRYSGASALAEEIGRYLSGQPISARLPTVTYQLRKLVTRHKLSAALLAALFVLTVGGAVALGVLFAKANTNLARARIAETSAEAEAENARQEAAVATQIKDFLVDVFRVSDPEVSQGKTITARQLLDTAAKDVKSRVRGDPLVQATLLATIGEVYGNLALYDEASDLLSMAYAKRRELIPGSKDTAMTAANLGYVCQRRGDLDGAQRAYLDALEIVKKMPQSEDLHELLMLKNLAAVSAVRSDLDTSEKSLRELLAVMRQSPKEKFNLPGMLNTLAGVLSEREKYFEAAVLMEEAIAVAKGLGPMGKQMIRSLEGNLGWVLAMSGRNEEAEVLVRRTLDERRRTLPEQHPDLATPLITLGVIQLNRKDPAGAEPLFREALAARRSALDENQPEVAEAKGFVGQCLTQLGRFDEAEQVLLESFRAFDSNPNAAAHERKEATTRLAKLYEASDRPDQAMYWRSMATVRRTATTGPVY